jgi:uncharacterized SAM-binding protein YcdF (DUF218 family)
LPRTPPRTAPRTPPNRQAGRRPVRHATVHRRRSISRRPNWPLRATLAAAALCVALLAWAAIARQLAPKSNTSLNRFDAIIVLGTPADADGNPTPTQLSNVTEAVHEYERGVAPRLILTGGPAHNRFVEATVMAHAAHALGIPESALFQEPRSLDTIQNACYSEQIMDAHGWHSAEVISNAAHLPRSAMIFSRTPLEWRMHAAPTLSPDSPAYGTLVAFVETLKTLRFSILVIRGAVLKSPDLSCFEKVRFELF